MSGAMRAAVLATVLVIGCVPLGPAGHTDSGPVCGDGVCDDGEHETGCPQGCPGECPEDCHWCGDLKCGVDAAGLDENEYTCPVDCAVWCAAGSILFACPSDTLGCCPNPACGCCSHPNPDCSSDCCGP